jgi:hypothetical protein
MFPKHGFDHGSMRMIGAPRPSSLRRKQGRQFLPHLIAQKTSKHNGLQDQISWLRRSDNEYNTVIYCVYV